MIQNLAVFSMFGMTQFISQFFEGPWLGVGGPSRYFWGETSYLILSLVAKGLLGITLMSSVLIFDSFEDAVADA